MFFFTAAMIILLTGSLLLPFSGRGNLANIAGPLFAITGAVLALAAGVDAICTGGFDFISPWNYQLGGFHLKLDPLSGYFAMVIAMVCGLSALYGRDYLKPYANEKHLGVSWSMFLLLFASMLLVITAWNGVLFLVAWEIMSLSSFFLVIFESHRPGVLAAGWTYLVATHLGTAFLMVMFLLLGQNHSYDFNVIQASGPMATFLFVLAVIGFGTKAGFLPFHVWLPEAHPAAPSHVSAVMSAAMIKTGIYGILRISILMGPFQASWGWILIIVGALTGIFGVLSALSQQDLKRLLAYSSVENIGIIAIGLGLGFLGFATQHPVIGLLGIAGGMLHVLNHALFKSLLFFGAGAVRHATHTLEMEKMGGLMKGMPITGTTFVIGAAAICALPPLNGFISEFLIYFGSFSSLYGSKGTFSVLAAVTVIIALALIGGLALACFTKAAGIVFSGEPRTREAVKAKESGVFMPISMGILVALCVYIGLFSPQVMAFLGPVFDTIVAGHPLGDATLAPAVVSLTMVSRVGAGLIALIVFLGLVKRSWIQHKVVEKSTTWGCGYAAPTAKMQYTASSFADPIVSMFDTTLYPEKNLKTDPGLFPTAFSYESRSKDIFMHHVYRPLFSIIESAALGLHWLQRGYNQLYVLYIVLTLLALLFWILWV
ncbi:MAG: proton-conducting transporter membrane subunit [Desulfobacterium sp.]